MKNNSNLKKYLFLIFIVINISSETTYLEYDLISNKPYLNPLSIISKDNKCQIYIPSLFNPIPLIKNGIYEETTSLHQDVIISNPIMERIQYDIYQGSLTDYNIDIIFGIRRDTDTDICYFGLSSGLQESVDLKDKNNTLEYLKINNQIDEKKFSIDKWDLNLLDQNMIKSKLYLGYSHKDFNSQNKKYIGTCENIKEDTFWGCYFKQMIFNNFIIPLKKSEEEDYKIFFSSEDYTIKFPESFINTFLKDSNSSCTFDSLNSKTICKNEFKEDLFIPLTLSNDNMDITLEIDSSKRFDSDKDQESIDMIFDVEIDYIIFPLKMFKNFHIQFDADNNIIKFYSTNKNILHVKIKDEPQQENNSSSALTVFLVILIIILLLGLGFGILFFIKKRRNGKSEEINKFTKFEDEDDFKNMQEKKIY